MKKILLLIAIGLFVSVSANAGMVRALNNSYSVSTPEFDHAEFMKIVFYYSDSGNHRAVIHYYPVDVNGNKIGGEKSVALYDRPDNPATDPAQCLAENAPYDCCTGAYPGDQNAACDEEVTNFSAFTNGFLSTLANRADIAVEAQIQKEFSVAP